jgi:hypothetical protein
VRTVVWEGGGCEPAPYPIAPDMTRGAMPDIVRLAVPGSPPGPVRSLHGLENCRKVALAVEKRNPRLALHCGIARGKCSGGLPHK